MDMSRLSQYVEDEFQTFLELLCPSAIVLRSQMPKESIEISNILIKEENIEVLSKVKEETIKLLGKGKKVLQIVKEEMLKLPKTKNHQDESIIAYIDKIYKESFNKFIYFQWIAKSIVLVVRNNAKLVGQCKFARVQTHHTIRYTPTTYVATTNEDLDLIDFVNIFDLINTGVLTHEYRLHKFPELTHLFFWSNIGKIKEYH
jgi:hypothetical protein